MRIGIGVIIAIALLFYWWTKDHPQNAPAPAPVGSLTYTIAA